MKLTNNEKNLLEEIEKMEELFLFLPKEKQKKLFYGTSVLRYMLAGMVSGRGIGEALTKKKS